MRGQLFIICVVLVVVASFGACYGQYSPNDAWMQPSNTQSAAPSAPVNPTANNATAPATVGAGPEMSSGTAVMTVDNNFVYVLQEGKLYKFAKCAVNSCGTVLQQPCAPCPPVCTPCPQVAGTGPCPDNCGGMTYIPGNPSSTLTVTTLTPCTPPCPNPCPSGAGPDPCNPCPTSPCPAPCVPSCGPSSTVSCTSCVPSPCPATPCPTSSRGPCDPCPQPTYTTTISTAPAGQVNSPCACPPIATVSSSMQQTIDCLQRLCGVDADKAYLQAMIQLNLQVLALSNDSSDHLGTTSLQDYATNSIADSRSNIKQARDWLRTKYCLDVTVCAPSIGGFDICDISRSGKAFDDAYRNQLVQFYVDEIALSQVELQNGLDCKVKEFAAKTIKDDQVRISRLKRCNSCI